MRDSVLTSAQEAQLIQAVENARKAMEALANQYKEWEKMASEARTMEEAAALSNAARNMGVEYNQIVNITSPTALTPYEVARQTKNATREMVLAFAH